jgi:hypothetical protein
VSLRVVFEFDDVSDINKSDAELIEFAKRVRYRGGVADARAVQVIREDGTAVEVTETPSPFCDDPDCEACHPSSGVGGDGHIW